jgi:hypothetical protein
MRLKRDRRAISNVIVVMLSLVLIVVVVTNVVLWSYQMNESDWERMREDVKITEVSQITSSWFLAQGEYTTNVGSKMSGTYRDTQAVDDHYESFKEGLDWWNPSYSYRRQATIVNNAQSLLRSNYSVGVAMDTASLVSTSKILPNGNDLRVVFLSNGKWVELDREVKDVNSTSTQIWFETQSAIAASGSDSDYFIYYGNPTAGSPPGNRSNVYLWFDDFNRPDNPDITTEPSYDIKTGGGTWSVQAEMLMNVGADGDPNKLVLAALGNVTSPIDMLVKINVTSFVGGDNSRMGLSCCMDTSPSNGGGYCGLFHEDTSSLDLLNDLRSWGTSGTTSWSLDTWYYMRFRVIDPSSRLGQVKVWQVGATEPTTWTVNGDFGSGMARNWGSVGFAGSKTTDTTYFDDITIRYITDPEPIATLGTEENQATNILDIDGTFIIDLVTYPLTDIQTIEMQMRYRADDTGEKWYLKAYNTTSSTYSDSGFNFTTGQKPTTGWDYYTMNLTDQWKSYVYSNGTMRVKMVDEGPDQNQTTIDIDFLGISVVANGTEFTFGNEAALTCHLVSLWINNSTNHQRYDISLFIDSGQTLTYRSFDLCLPNEPYVVKVVTERGNIAIYRGDTT